MKTFNDERIKFAEEKVKECNVVISDIKHDLLIKEQISSNIKIKREEG